MKSNLSMIILLTNLSTQMIPISSLSSSSLSSSSSSSSSLSLNDSIVSVSSEEDGSTNDSSVTTTTSMSAKLEMVVLTLIFVMIIVGNIPIVITIIFGKLVKTRMYYFLLHLCFADLITGVFTVITQLGWEFTKYFYGGNILCKSVKYLQILGPYLSSYTLVAMSIDRFLAICYPLSNNHLSLNRAKKSIAASWAIALSLCSPQAFIFSYTMTPYDKMDCWGVFPFEPWGVRFYVTWYAMTQFFIPFSIIFFTNFKICWELWGTSNNFHPPQTPSVGGQSHRLSTQGLNQPHRLSMSTNQSHRLSMQGLNSTTHAPLITTTSVDDNNVIRTSVANPNRVRMSITAPSTPSEVQPLNSISDLNPLNHNYLKLNHNHNQELISDQESISNQDIISGQEVISNQAKSPLKGMIGNSIKSSTSFISSRFKHAQSRETADLKNGDESEKKKEEKERKRDSHSPTPASLTDIPPSSSSFFFPGGTGGRGHSIEGAHAHSIHGTHDDEHRRAKVKSVKLTVTVILCYVFCSLPFIVVQLWACWWPGAHETDAWRGPIIKVFSLMASLNSCANPWIYLIFNTRLYRACKRLFCCCFKSFSGTNSTTNHDTRHMSEGRSF